MWAETTRQFIGEVSGLNNIGLFLTFYGAQRASWAATWADQKIKETSEDFLRTLKGGQVPGIAGFLTLLIFIPLGITLFGFSMVLIAYWSDLELYKRMIAFFAIFIFAAGKPLGIYFTFSGKEDFLTKRYFAYISKNLASPESARRMYYRHSFIYIAFGVLFQFMDNIFSSFGVDIHFF